MRRRAKVDANQPEITAALRKAGASVLHLHSVAGGCGDILVGFRKRNFLLEIKDGNAPVSQRKLTPAQVEFHLTWQGQITVVETVMEALAAIGFYEDVT